MKLQSKVLHTLLATAIVFANFVCPCASASADSEVQGQQHQHQEAPADADCSHQQCPGCSSALAVSCDKSTLVSPSPHLTKLDLDDDDTQLDAVAIVQVTRPPPLTYTDQPYANIAFMAESPVRRHDLQLE